MPVETAKAVLAREVGRHNREAGRRCPGARGRSYDAMLRDGLAEREAIGRPLRVATAGQLYNAGLIWTPVTVDRNTQIIRDGWTYGGPESREALAPYRKGEPKNPTGGVQILLGRDPNDLSAPAIAFDDMGNLICRGIEPVTPGEYGSVDVVLGSARYRKAARKATKVAEAANEYLDDTTYAQAMAALNAAAQADDTPPSAPRKVVSARFGGPLSVQEPAPEADDSLSAVIEEFDRASGFDPRRVLSGL